MVGPPTGSGDSYYRRLGETRYRPTGHVEGAWQPGEQHMGPVAGLMTHALERFVAQERDDHLQLGRINFEILGMIAADDLDVLVEVLRPGRTIELLEATMVIRGRPVVRARAWRLWRQDTSMVAGGAPEPMPGPESAGGWDGLTHWGGGYIASIEVRPLAGRRPGRTRAWLRTGVGLVEGEPIGDLARYLGLVDTANGIAVRRPPAEWMFPNVDLSVHLHRQPQGPWVGLDTTVVFGADGVGLTSTVLHDLAGAIGRAEQILTLRPVVGPPH